MNGVQGEELTLGTTSAVNIVLTDVDKNEKKTFFIKVTSGSVKVGVGSIAAGAKAWGTTDTVNPYNCFNGELYVQGGASDKIVVTATP